MRKLVKKNGRTSNALEAYMLKAICDCYGMQCACGTFAGQSATVSVRNNNGHYNKVKLR